jgi:hypothetical protein
LTPNQRSQNNQLSKPIKKPTVTKKHIQTKISSFQQSHKKMDPPTIIVTTKSGPEFKRRNKDIQRDECERAKTKYVSWKNLSFDQRYLRVTSEISLPAKVEKGYKGQSTEWNGKKIKTAASSIIQCSFSIIKKEEELTIFQYKLINHPVYGMRLVNTVPDGFGSSDKSK